VRPAVFAITATATIVSWLLSWFFLPDHGAAQLWLLNVTAVAVPLVAAWLAWTAERMRPGRLLAGVCVLWSGGNVVWGWYEIRLGLDPFPSPADLFYLPALVLLGAAIPSWPGVRATRPAGEYTTPALAAVVALLAGYELLLGPVIADGLGRGRDALALAYPAADLLLLAAASACVVLPGTRQRGRLSLLAVGIAFLLLGDASFAETSILADWPDEVGTFGWDFAFLGIGAAAVVHERWGVRRLTLGDASVGAALSLALAAAVAHQAWQIRDHGIETVDTLGLGGLLVVLVIRAWRTSSEGAVQLESLARAQSDLERAQALREATMDASRTGNCVFAEDGNTAFCNSAFLELLGIEAHDCAEWGTFVRFLSRVSAARDDGVIGAEPGEVLRFWTSEGRYLEVRVEAIATGELLVVVDDLTAREQETATRARFVAEIVGAQEREARRIGELLHDDAVQQLTALALRLELAALQRGDESLSALARDASGVTSSLRTLLVQLHPAVLESQGLVPAIESAAETLRAQGVEVVVGPYARRHPPEIERLVYRLVQEAFANAYKHAGARRVTVELTSNEHVLLCRVADDGRGFDTSLLRSAVSRGHLGLHLLQERVELTGGTVSIESTTGEGTTLDIVIPSSERDAALEEVA
jgi:signal transduction histidine kinase